MPSTRSLLSSLFDRLAPRRCALCRETLAAGRCPGVCTGCLIALPGASTHRCAVCAMPTAAGVRWCGDCQSDPPPYDLTLAAADYAPPLDRAITALKFGRRLALARPLGELLAVRWLGGTGVHDDAPPALDCLVPIPLGAARLASRGFNQSLQLARACTAALHAAGRREPMPGHGHGHGQVRLRRVRETLPQSSLDLLARSRNLDGCFEVRGDAEGLRIGLVDDVMTTGSTLAEAARTLKRAGAAAVVNLVVARTP
jgi:ComF family protein